MKFRILIATLITSTLLSGCGLFTKTKPVSAVQTQPAKAQLDAQVHLGDENFSLQKIAFATGMSSVTVEKLASKNQCLSKQGAGQITPKGPTEVYRVSCDDGRVFMAKCELRQCQPMMLK